MIGGWWSTKADAHWIKADGNRKPVVGFIAGVTAPQDVQWVLLVDLMILLKLKANHENAEFTRFSSWW
jgi:succinyl-CoA synthetase alpha subunit